VALHVIANFSGFKRHLGSRRGQILIGLFVVVLVLSFVGPKEQGEPPFMQPIRALSTAPLTTLAKVARISPIELRERLSKTGLQPTTDQQSLRKLCKSHRIPTSCVES
jgi:hypothetical protein